MDNFDREFAQFRKEFEETSAELENAHKVFDLEYERKSKRIAEAGREIACRRAEFYGTAQTAVGAVQESNVIEGEFVMIGK